MNHLGHWKIIYLEKFDFVEQQQNKKYYLQPFFFALFLAVGVLLGTVLVPAGPGMYSGQGNRISEVMGLIEGYYVDTVNADDLEEKAITDLLQGLDPHSVFIPAKDIEAVNEPLEGEFDGIGVEFNILDDTVYVVNIIEGGPSEKAGLQAGDRIITVDDSLFSGTKLTNERVVKTLKGRRGTSVNVGIKRYGKKELLPIEIVRGTIPVHSVDAHFMIDNQTGYIKLVRFSATTSDEVRDALHALKGSGMQNLVLDLRGNPGGYLNAAIQVADEFLNGKKLIVYTEGRTQARKTYKAGRRGNFEDGKLVVLLDEQSASASEIVSGAIQDWDRGIIVGRRSYGKGLVQEPFELTDHSVIRLTISRYYTPTGRSIQKSYQDGYEKYQMEVYDRWENGELENQDSVKSIDSLKYTTPAGRIFYGGGGIYPDIFVGLDTSFSRSTVSAIYQKALHRRFVYQYLEQNREELKKYATAMQFARNFRFSAKDHKAFIEILNEAGIQIPEPDMENTLNYLFTDMRALLARQLFDINAFYMVSNQDDHFIKAAMKSLNEYDKLLAPEEH
ncbi:MAG: PDZ domain-containing protein [Bacteroidetes bacterium]|nr:PDZ domain-containing protein [Bacteroidota bacterium]